MTRPHRPPDLVVNFHLAVLRDDGTSKNVRSGYRPAYYVMPDYWSSARHEFLDEDGINTGETGLAEVWLLTPEVYPATFWSGRCVEVAEGSRIVGTAEVVSVINPILKSPESDDTNDATEK